MAGTFGENRKVEIETGGYAFPVPEAVNGGNNKQPTNKGMSLRDYFAAAALQGLLSRPAANNTIPRSRTSIAASAYAWADALIEARDRKPQGDAVEQ